MMMTMTMIIKGSVAQSEKFSILFLLPYCVSNIYNYLCPEYRENEPKKAHRRVAENLCGVGLINSNKIVGTAL